MWKKRWKVVYSFISLHVRWQKLKLRQGSMGLRCPKESSLFLITHTYAQHTCAGVHTCTQQRGQKETVGYRPHKPKLWVWCILNIILQNDGVPLLKEITDHDSQMIFWQMGGLRCESKITKSMRKDDVSRILLVARHIRQKTCT